MERIWNLKCHNCGESREMIFYVDLKSINFSCSTFSVPFSSQRFFRFLLTQNWKQNIINSFIKVKFKLLNEILSKDSLNKNSFWVIFTNRCRKKVDETWNLVIFACSWRALWHFDEFPWAMKAFSQMRNFFHIQKHFESFELFIFNDCELFATSCWGLCSQSMLRMENLLTKILHLNCFNDFMDIQWVFFNFFNCLIELFAWIFIFRMNFDFFN